MIDFCQLGFIGKMFKAVELPWLVQFFLMFYNDKPGASLIFLQSYFKVIIDILPVDWLLENLIQTKVGKLDPYVIYDIYDIQNI